MIRRALLALALLAGCTPSPPPRVAEYPPMAAASLDCIDGPTSPAATAICADPDLAAAERALGTRLARRLGAANLFERDRLLAAARGFWLDLGPSCPAAEPACLGRALAARRTALEATPPAPPGAEWGDGAYLRLRTLDAHDPPRCTAIAARLTAAAAGTGRLDPGPGVVAGTDAGTDRAAAIGHTVEVVRQDSGAAGAFRRGATAILLDGRPALDAASLGDAARRRENEGGRPGSFASATGDEAVMDVIVQGPDLLGFVADPVGEQTPNGPGEYAYAGLWRLAAPPSPLCLFTTYRMPEAPDLARYPALAAWLAALDALRADPPPGLDLNLWRDSADAAREARWIALAMPLKLRALARAKDWTAWLRARHDRVLDTLRAAHADAALAATRPAAADLLRLYAAQGLDAAEAREAAAAAIMELLYASTLALAPGLGADRTSAAPREPIIP